MEKQGRVLKELDVLIRAFDALIDSSIRRKRHRSYHTLLLSREILLNRRSYVNDALGGGPVLPTGVRHRMVYPTYALFLWLRTLVIRCSGRNRDRSSSSTDFTGLCNNYCYAFDPRCDGNDSRTDTFKSVTGRLYRLGDSSSCTGPWKSAPYRARRSFLSIDAVRELRYVRLGLDCVRSEMCSSQAPASGLDRTIKVMRSILTERHEYDGQRLFDDGPSSRTSGILTDTLVNQLSELETEGFVG